MTRKRIAVVGAGISGLSAAYELAPNHDVVIFEKASYFGGHTDTHTFNLEGRDVRIDSGFIIFCPEFYPNFFQMIEDLGVGYQPTDMSFSAHNRKSGVIYNASANLNKLFCDRRNLIRPAFYKMLWDLARFYRTSPQVLKSADTDTTVEQYLNQHRYGDMFIHDHLFPMISALWSATPERVRLFPIRHLVEFFQNHGLLKLFNRPQWLVVKNGSASYVEALQKRLQCKWRLNTEIDSISRSEQGVEIRVNDTVEKFDAVVMACHADQSLQLLQDVSENEQSILSAIPFEQNHVIVHTDESVMHPNKTSWASWNTEVPNDFDVNTQRVCTANYWMNSLQGLDLNSNVFVSLNSQHKINPNKVLRERHYAHPVFTKESVAAQKRLDEINGTNHTYFVGAYWGWGFHEDGARSAANAVALLQKNINKQSVDRELTA